MIQDIENSAKCVARINAFWRKLGVNAEAHIGRSGEIESRLTDGIPPVRIPQSKLNAATAASGAFRAQERA